MGQHTALLPGWAGHIVHQKSSLELRLHKLKFIDLLAHGKKMEAIRYARQASPPSCPGRRGRYRRA